jgi:predicted nucleic acid-binding protein
MNLFFDTSAVVKLYHKETGTNNLINSLQRHSDNLILLIADISRLEFRSAVMKRVRIKEIKLKAAQNMVEMFDNDMRMFNVVEVNIIVKNLAMQLLEGIAPKTNLGTLDAIQLATSVLTHQGIAIDYFVACDKRLLSFAKQYFNTFNPEIETI